MTVELDLSIDWLPVVVIQLAEIFYGILKKVQYKKRMVKNEWEVSHYSLLQMRVKNDYRNHCQEQQQEQEARSKYLKISCFGQRWMGS